jgi:hypothetical protein
MTGREGGMQPQWGRCALERALIGEGSEVVSDDLERIGSILRLTFDASDRLLSVTAALLVNNAEIEVPAAVIVSADDGSLYLRCTRHDLCAAPAHAAGTALPVLA